MGNNLSSTFEPDTSGVVYATYDRDASIMVGAIWGIVAYMIGMIWTTFHLIDRWRGPYDKFRTGGSTVLAALAMSSVWPMVVAFMIASR
jgi:hypothetical protein